MRSNEFILDEFAYIQGEILPLFMILMYLLPIYRFTSRIVGEKRSGVRDLTRVMGLSEWSYWLSWFYFYVCGMLLISVACTTLLTFLVLNYTEFLPLLILLTLYGLSLFGYILVM